MATKKVDPSVKAAEARRKAEMAEKAKKDAAADKKQSAKTEKEQDETRQHYSFWTKASMKISEKTTAATEKVADKIEKLGIGDSKEAALQKEEIDSQKRIDRLAKKDKRKETIGKIKDQFKQNKAYKVLAFTMRGTSKAIHSGLKMGMKPLAKGLKAISGFMKDKLAAGLGFAKQAMKLGLMAVMAFLTSKYWKNIKAFIMDDLVPVLEWMWDKVLKPLGEVFKNYVWPAMKAIGGWIKNTVMPILGKLFIKQIEVITELFENLKKAFKKFADGDILGGLTDIIKGIGKFLWDTIDNTATAIFNLIASIFGFKGTGEDNIFGVISKFFNDIWTKIKEIVGGTIKKIQEFFSWDWAEVKKSLTVANFIDIVLLPYNLAIKWLRGVFGWGKRTQGGPPGTEGKDEFRLSTFIFDVVKKIKKFFTDMFTFDFTGTVKKMKGKILNIGKFIKAVAAAGAAAVAAGFPGGESPGEAYKRVYDEHMGKGGEVVSGGGSSGKSDYAVGDSKYTPTDITRAKHNYFGSMRTVNSGAYSNIDDLTGGVDNANDPVSTTLKRTGTIKKGRLDGRGVGNTTVVASAPSTVNTVTTNNTHPAIPIVNADPIIDLVTATF